MRLPPRRLGSGAGAVTLRVRDDVCTENAKRWGGRGPPGPPGQAGVLSLRGRESQEQSPRRKGHPRQRAAGSMFPKDEGRWSVDT